MKFWNDLKDVGPSLLWMLVVLFVFPVMLVIAIKWFLLVWHWCAIG